MRALSTTVVLLLFCAGCFGGFEQPPKASKQKRTSTSPTSSTSAEAAEAGDDSDKKKKKKQSYTEAWKIICSAGQQVPKQQRGSVAPLSRTERGAAIANWIVENLKNKKARYWFIGFGKVKKKRRVVFMKEAQKGGQPDCPLAAFLFDPPTSKPNEPITPR